MKIKKQIHLSGTLVYDAELRFTSYGKAMCVMEISDGTDYHHCIAWGALGECIVKEYDDGRKGARVEITGLHRKEEWIDAEGKEHSKDVIVITEYKEIP